jgi:hypothetical protein
MENLTEQARREWGLLDSCNTDGTVNYMNILRNHNRYASEIEFSS